MSSDPAFFMVNLSLYYYQKNESQVLKQEIYTKYVYLAICFCYTDSFFNHEQSSGILLKQKRFYIFYKNYEDLSELKLKRENVSTSIQLFLNLSIVIDNNEFKTKLYEKRDALPFSVDYTRHLDSDKLSDIEYHLEAGKLCDLLEKLQIAIPL